VREKGREKDIEKRKRKREREIKMDKKGRRERQNEGREPMKKIVERSSLSILVLGRSWRTFGRHDSQQKKSQKAFSIGRQCLEKCPLDCAANSSDRICCDSCNIVATCLQLNAFQIICQL
jgi:hypothetical protein